MVSVVVTARSGFGIGKKSERPRVSGSTRRTMPETSRMNQMTSRRSRFQISQTIAFLITSPSLSAVFMAPPPPTAFLAALPRSI